MPYKPNPLKSITKSSKKDMAETYLSNEDFKKNKWSLHERLLIFMSRKATSSVVLIFLYITLITVIYNLFLNTSIQTETSSGIISSIIATQATLIGLIFPIVIAFIGFLLQGKSANEVMWEIYKETSLLPLIGLSSLGLILFITTSLTIIQFSDIFIINIASQISSMWLAVNIVLSSYFLFKTLEFLSEHHRMKIILKYTLNETLKNEISNKLALKHAEIWITSYNNKKCINDISIIPHAINYNDDAKNYVQLKKGFTDIKLQLLSISIKSINKSIRKGIYSDKSKLSIPLDDFINYNICIKIDKSSPRNIRLLHRLFLRISFKKKTHNRKHVVKSSQIINALYSEIEDALKDNNSKKFRTSSQELQEFICIIVESCYFVDKNSTKANLLLLENQRYSFSTFLSLLIKEGQEISSMAARRIKSDNKMFQTWCYFHYGLYKSTAAQEIIESYIHAHSMTWVALLKLSDEFNSFTNLEDENFNSAVKYFIGSWESWKYKINVYDKEDTNEQIHLKNYYLERCSFMISVSLSNNNITAASWAADSLLNAYKDIIDYEINANYYIYNSSILNVCINPDDFGDYMDSFLNSQDLIEGDIKSISLINGWIDLRMITITHIINIYDSIKIGSLKSLVSALLFDEKIYPASDITSHHPINTIDILMDIFFRMSIISFNNIEYIGRIERHLRDLSLPLNNDEVSGRIYKSKNISQRKCIIESFKTIGVTITKKQYSLSKEWIDLFNHSSAFEIEKTICDLDELKHIDELNENKAKTLSLYKGSIEENKQYFIDSIKSSIEALEALKNEKG